jgi:phage shock protein A
MSPTMQIDSATTLRATQITRIIQKRTPLAQKIETVETNLKALSEALRQLEKQRGHLLERVSDPGTSHRLNEVDCSTIQKSINLELVSLKSLKSRFSRNTLNIGVVGRARQGKSRLLQSLTGLSRAEIPDGDNQHCTGVRSNIHHDSNVEETYAEVSFHTEHSFLDEVIAPYYDQLGLGARPSSIQNFADVSLPKLPPELSEKTQEKAKYDHLCRYHEYLDKYRDTLSEISPRRISRHEIREYVAQDNREGERIYFNYLAVREVKIVCSFPNVDIGQIALVDMPGLGDTGIGDEERMMRALGQDIDLVLFVKMPNATGDYWGTEDLRLHNLANSTLVDIPIKEWSFMVLNHIDGQNSNRKNCDRLASSMAEKHINVQDYIIANCANEEEAQTKILDRILDYLGSRVELLDRQYATACQDRLNQIQKDVAIELGKANAAWKQSSKDDEYPIFIKRFKMFWDDLTRELEALTLSTISERNIEDENFKTAVDSAIAACRLESGIPQLEEIKQRCSARASHAIAYDEYLHEVRTHLSKNFLSLDIALKESVERTKNRVAQILKTHGKLEKIAEGNGSEFLKNLAEKISENAPELKLGFETLATFDLQYRGLLQHRIRKHLDNLIPNTTKYKFDDSSFMDKWIDTKTKTIQVPSPAEKIFNNLSKAQSEAVNKCEKELKTLLTEPSQACFSIVEEFIDRILRAKDVEDEWSIFLKEVAPDVWVDDFGITRELTQLRQGWMQMIGEVERVKQADALNFLR